MSNAASFNETSRELRPLPLSIDIIKERRSQSSITEENRTRQIQIQELMNETCEIGGILHSNN